MRRKAPPPDEFELWIYTSGLPVNPYGVPAHFVVRISGGEVSGVHGPAEGYLRPPHPISYDWELLSVEYRTDPWLVNLLNEARALRAVQRDSPWELAWSWDRERTLQLRLEQEKRAHSGDIRAFLIIVGFVVVLAIGAGGWRPW